ncbi:MAG: hypothetical protein ABJ327_14090 [Litoreibacter sp.]
MSNRYSVRTKWEAAYKDPIVLHHGEELWLNGDTHEWEGHVWVWAKNQANKEGWIPDTLVKTAAGKHYANAPFSAQELSCEVGEYLVTTNEKHGWIWCRSEAGLEGWVPKRNLNLLAGTQSH